MNYDNKANLLFIVIIIIIIVSQNVFLFIFLPQKDIFETFSGTDSSCASWSTWKHLGDDICDCDGAQ